MKEQEEYKYKKKEERYQEANELPIEHNSKEINQEVKAELEEQLQELEVVRKRYFAKYQIRNRVYWSAITLLVTSILLLVILGPILQLEFDNMVKVIAVIFGLFLIIFVSQFLKKKVEEQYKHHFKYTVLERIVDLFFSDLRYTPKRMIAEADFEKSRIEHTFEMIYKDYNGEDYFEGSYKGYPISFSEIITSYTKRVVKQRNGKRDVSYIHTPLFNGLFFMLETTLTTANSSFWGVCPTYNGQALSEFTVLDDGMKEIMLGASFVDKKDKKFSYQLLDGSRSIDPKLIKAVSDLGEKLGEPVWVTYDKGRLYIGVSTFFNLAKDIIKNMEGKSLIKQSTLLAKAKTKDNGLYLFSPPNLKVSVLDNKEILLKPIEEIQSCLDIVDEILVLFNQVQRLED